MTALTQRCIGLLKKALSNELYLEDEPCMYCLALVLKEMRFNISFFVSIHELRRILDMFNGNSGEDAPILSYSQYVRPKSGRTLDLAFQAESFLAQPGRAR